MSAHLMTVVEPPVLAWRYWSLASGWRRRGYEHDVQLVSPQERRFVWSKRRNDDARCPCMTDGVCFTPPQPPRSCFCGFAAYRTRRELFRWHNAASFPRAMHGAVRLEGTILEGRLHLRAERLEILLLLWSFPEDRRDAEAVAARLGVPLGECPVARSRSSRRGSAAEMEWEASIDERSSVLLVGLDTIDPENESVAS